MTTRCTETRRAKSISAPPSRAAEHPPPLEKDARVVNVFVSVGLLVLPELPHEPPPSRVARSCRSKTRAGGARRPECGVSTSRVVQEVGTVVAVVLSLRRRRTTLSLG